MRKIIIAIVGVMIVTISTTTIATAATKQTTVKTQTAAVQYEIGDWMSYCVQSKGKTTCEILNNSYNLNIKMSKIRTIIVDDKNKIRFILKNDE